MWIDVKRLPGGIGVVKARRDRGGHGEIYGDVMAGDGRNGNQLRRVLRAEGVDAVAMERRVLGIGQFAADLTGL